MSDDTVGQIVITVNGPGEVSGWLYPLATALKSKARNVRLCVAVVPCTFSSGAELDVIQSQPYVDAACGVGGTKDLILRNRLPEGFRRGGPGVVLHLGGETILTWLIAKRLQLPCIAYAEHPFMLSSRFDGVVYSGMGQIPSDKGGDKPTMIGELMVDAARLRCPDREPARRGRLTVGLYPGSRDYIAKYMLPFYGAVADIVAEAMPDVEWALSKADYLSMDFLRNIPTVEEGRPLEGQDLAYDDADGQPALRTKRGVRIPILPPGEVAPRVNLALTIPGSNTAEMAALGVPMVVTLPTWQAETSPLPGLAGHIAKIPLVGRYIKRALGHLFLRSIRFTSHPNRRARRMVVPEIVGHIKARDVAAQIIAKLKSDMQPIEDDLRSVMGPPGASERLTELLLPFLNGADRRHGTT